MVGAGVMGGDIAAWCAQRGLNVTLQDRELKFIEPALTRAREAFAKRLKDPGKAAELMTRVTADVAGDGVPGADVIIEAIFENAEAKHELFARVEPRMKASAILASNTSSIMLEQLDDQPAGSGQAGRPALLQSGGAAAAGGNRARRNTAAKSRSRRPSPSRARSTNCRCPARARRAFS